ncbi:MULTISPECIES: hypothetical protein [unclassified Massilia]|uniref:hypothetical protein n=1 Tax=unclassified Massilia TaxID=2609279 RepID=UPI00177E6302|nr:MULTISPECIES: hypothetical protein [unclassified Massilia]MBD8528425.1 hypothetical protein [Massilia sp. CFBP 13647]MBD8671953.1 hypothetical protein [Massilia sp. CFBP 13721]
MADATDHEKQLLKLEIEKHAHERWWQEDELVNQRTTWLLTTQAVLGTAYGFLLYRIAEVRYSFADPPVANAAHYIDVLLMLTHFLAVIGIGSATMSMAGIFAACRAQYALRNNSPFLGVTPGTTAVGQLVAVGTPVLFIMAWIGSFLLTWLVSDWTPGR